MPESAYSQVVAAVRQFQSVDLLASVAALQLVPQNYGQTIRLEALAHAVAGQSVSVDAQGVGIEDLERLCNEPPLASYEIIGDEDPPERLFTEPLGWRRGTYIALPGVADDSAFVIRHLALALDILPEFFPNQTFLTDAARTLRAGLLIVDAVARRASLVRWAEAAPLPGRKTFIPAADELHRLKASVRFTQAQMAELLAPVGGVSAIGALIAALGEPTRRHGARTGRLLQRPIVRHEDEYIIALPGALLDAVRHGTLTSATELGVAAALGQRYIDAAWKTVRESLADRLDMSLVSESPLDTTVVPNTRQGLFRHDTDALTHVLLVADPLRSYDRDAIFGRWPLANFTDRLGTRINEAARRVMTKNTTDKQLMTLLLVHGTGYSYEIGVPGSMPEPFLAMRCAELEELSYIEAGDSVALWKYALASAALQRRVHVMSTSQLDQFAIYRQHRHTFYVSDEALPSAMSVQVGTALALRKDTAVRYDPHPVLNEGGTAVSHVIAQFGPHIPVYSDLGRAGRQAAIVVEGLAIPVWVTGPWYRDSLARQQHSVYANLVETIAYWLWQLTPGLLEASHVLAEDISRLTIRLTIPANFLNPSADPDGAPAFAVSVDQAAVTVNLKIGAPAESAFSSPDNQGERELMTAVVAGIQELLPADARGLLGTEARSKLIDTVAPLGSKKHFLVFDTSLSPDLDGEGLPRHRPIQEADVEKLLDELGEQLREKWHRALGEVPRADRSQLLQDIVTFFYDALQSEVDALDRESLLPFLIAQHEATVHESAFRALTVPTRLACFSTVPEMVSTLTDEIPKLARASLAERFLIEYVAAKPPSGTRQIGLCAYDRLLALAHHVINFGFLSDTLHLGLVDTGLAVLSSGRLGVENDEFSTALRGFLGSFAADVVSRSMRDADAVADGTPPNPTTNLFSELQTASEAEFGESLADIATLSAAAVNIGRSSHAVVVTKESSRLIQELVDLLGWSPEKISKILDGLALEPREDFLAPSPPHAGRDVYPWKFGRSLSYLRRPFLRITVGGTLHVTWGWRHLHMAMRHLITICATGRLVAKSQEMKSAMSARNHRRGKAFNERVADVLRDNGLTVETRVAGFGSLRMPRELGDIDVFAIDRQRVELRLIECKDLGLARTPSELANQLAALIPKQPGDPGAATVRHERRAEWARRHLAEIVQHIGLDEKANWNVAAAFVVDEPLFATHLRKVNVPVISLETLRSGG
jgi:hypothetical protein